MTARPGSRDALLHRWWWHLSLIALALLLGVRWLRYLPVPWPPALDHLLGGLMIYETQLFMWPYVLSRIFLKIVLVAGVLGVLFLRRRLLRRDGGVLRFTPLLVSLLCAAMLWLHYLFDASPFVALMCALSLPLAWRTPSTAAAPSAPRSNRGLARAAAWAAFLGAWLWLACDFADRGAVAFWALICFGMQRWAPQILGVRERRLLLTLAVIPANLVPALLPLVVPWHGGTRFGDGLAYDFCQVPGRGTLLATLPACDSLGAAYLNCGRGQVVAYDPVTLERVAAYHFFSPSYYGRLEQIVCLEDEVEVAVQSTSYRDRMADQTALSFSVASPERFRPLAAGRGVGNTILYDPVHDALFYTGEYSHRIVRYDRRTREFDERVGEPFRRRWFHPLLGSTQTGSLMMPSGAIDPQRNRIYPVEWMQGRYAYAIDTSTLRPVARYDVQSGGSWGATVDAERGRLLVVSLWGMEVFDLDTGALIARKRLGFIQHAVVVDTVRNRVYVGSIVEGKIRVLDRDSLATIGQVPIGMGTRYPYLSADGTRLFATSARAHYYWDASTLVSRP